MHSYDTTSQSASIQSVQSNSNQLNVYFIQNCSCKSVDVYQEWGCACLYFALWIHWNLQFWHIPADSATAKSAPHTCTYIHTNITCTKCPMGLLTFLPVSFQKVPHRLKLSCGWKKEKKKKRKTSSHTHPPRQYHPHTESGEGQHVKNIVNINSFRLTWLCMHLMKHAPFM